MEKKYIITDTGKEVQLGDTIEVTLAKSFKTYWNTYKTTIIKAITLTDVTIPTLLELGIIEEIKPKEKTNNAKLEELIKEIDGLEEAVAKILNKAMQACKITHDCIETCYDIQNKVSMKNNTIKAILKQNERENTKC